ncbi:Fic family protein [Verrucomicrobiales bacterium]|nr:Fic family protein [Verrucomicrobiales bacterium]
MAHKNIRNDLIQVLIEANSPLAISEILENTQVEASRRTVQRHLEQLENEGAVMQSGRARATRYEVSPSLETRVGEKTAMDAPAPKSVDYNSIQFPGRESALGILHHPSSSPTEVELPSLLSNRAPLSTEAQNTREIIRQDQALRKPVGYQRSFLDSYIPNKTRYLPAKLAKQLRREGQSKDMAELPPGTYARTVLDRLLIDLSWNSSRLEGNTYSLLETDHLLNQRRSADGPRFLEAQMIINHKEAIEFLVDDPMALGYDRYTYFNLHAILSQGLLASPKGEGRIRDIKVGISGTVFHPENTIQVIEECFMTILEKAGQISDPLEASFFLMVHLPYLQPFEDCNKRVSRIGCNLPLIQANLAPFSFVGVPKRDYTDAILAVYELNDVSILRDVFAWAYRQSAAQYAIIREELGEPDPMRVRYREELKECVRSVVVAGLDKPSAASAVRRWTKQEVTASHQERFIEIAEGLLISLSEGNIVRMRIRKSEFDAWWPGWIAKE